MSIDYPRIGSVKTAGGKSQVPFCSTFSQSSLTASHEVGILIQPISQMRKGRFNKEKHLSCITSEQVTEVAFYPRPDSKLPPLPTARIGDTSRKGKEWSVDFSTPKPSQSLLAGNPSLSSW